MIGRLWRRGLLRQCLEQPLLTQTAGPDDVAQKCLEMGAMETAASYLIIIQTLEPVGVSSTLAENLLCRVFDSGDFE